MTDAPRSLWRAALLSPPHSALTYAAPEDLGGDSPPLAAGMRVLVPLGRSLRTAVLLGPADEPEGDFAVKPIVWPLERAPMLDVDYMAMVHDLATRQMTEPGRILAAVLPRGLRTSQVRFRCTCGAFPGFTPAKTIGKFTPVERALWARRWLEGAIEPAIPAAADDRALRLTVDPPWPVRPGATQQARILDFLFDRGPTPRALVTKELGSGVSPALARLLKLGHVVEDVCDETEPFCGCELAEPLAGFAPTDEQAAALTELTADLNTDEPAIRLLFGVTGSGKTLVYLRLVREALARGRSAVLLAPEVALACGLFRTTARELPEARVVFHHGYQSPTKREATFRELARLKDSGEPFVVVGTRSALFLPLPHLGLIILDEEHDESFKQEERLPYQAKEVAYSRMQRAGGLLVLGSATPDVKTFQASVAGHLGVSKLARRVGARPLPSIRMVDVAERGESAFAEETTEALTRTLDAGEQAIIMLNRRGFAPVMYCLTCREPVKCQACEVGYTYHKSRERLICHYCGDARGWPSPCPQCGGGNFTPVGEGTEGLEEQLGEIVGPERRVLRLDRDTTRRAEKLEDILERFGRGEAQVLVGTQMLSKGHHFPNVTLVVAAQGDQGRNVPDYRASERVFQLLVQVAGRAGRGESPGEVLIQTRNPSDPFWQFVASQDYEGFFASEIERRRTYGYPPFARLALVRMSHRADEKDGPALLARAAQVLRAEGGKLGLRVMGPAPAPMAMLRGRKRFHCLVKGPDWPSIRGLYGRLVAERNLAEKLRLSLDLDPLSML
jgi:primosomal protein N' (replication factor Y)